MFWVEIVMQKNIFPGISIPVAEIVHKAGKLLKKGDTIVVYCASFECSASTIAAEKLKELGYKKVLDYKGGLKDYKEGGGKLEGTLHEGTACASCCACG